MAMVVDDERSMRSGSQEGLIVEFSHLTVWVSDAPTDYLFGLGLDSKILNGWEASPEFEAEYPYTTPGAMALRSARWAIAIRMQKESHGR